MVAPLWTVHPRSCGEQMGDEMKAVQKRGSSPLVRGTARPPDPLALRRRFIPARAGNSSHSRM